MHLYLTHDPQIDVRAYVASRKMRSDVDNAHDSGSGPDEIIEMVIDGLGPKSIGGYKVEVGERLRQILRPYLLTTQDSFQAAAAILIDYVAVQASTRDFEVIIKARDAIIGSLDSLAFITRLDVAS